MGVNFIKKISKFVYFKNWKQSYLNCKFWSWSFEVENLCSNTRVKKGFHKKGANCKLTVAPFFEKNYGSCESDPLDNPTELVYESNRLTL